VQSSNTTQISLSSLDSCTTYEYSVQTVCASGISAFTSGSFTTTGLCSAPCPVPGNITASPSGTSAAISWNTTGATTYTLQYRLQTGTTWTTVNNISSTSYTITGLSSCSSYVVKVMSVCSNATSAYSTETAFTTTGCSTGGGAPTNYCSSYSLNATAEYIQSFRVSNLNNVSGNNNGFGNFINLSANLVAGRTDTLRFAAGFTSTAYTEYWTVRIDFNRDGDFADAGETVAQLTSTGTALNTVAFTTPLTASVGQARMRVQMKRGAYATECDIYSNGEVEDYYVNMTGAAARHPLSTAAHTYSFYPNPASEHINIDFKNSGIRTVTVYDPTGREILTKRFCDDHGELDLSRRASGLYIFKVREGSSISTNRIVKH
jgi:hypothetical protein